MVGESHKIRRIGLLLAAEYYRWKEDSLCQPIGLAGGWFRRQSPGTATSTVYRVRAAALRSAPYRSVTFHILMAY